MTTLLDARPQGLNLLFRPDTTLTVEMEWPAGELAGRTFLSTLGAQTLTVTVVGDLMTVEASAAQTELFDVEVPADWALLEDLGGDPEPVLIGKWVPSLAAGTTHSTVSVITDGAVPINVSVFTGGLTTAALAAHAATPLDGVHGVVERNWAQDGVGDLTRTVMSQDGSNAFSASVVSRWLRFSASTANGSQREAWRLPNTQWANSEMTSLLGTSDLLAAPPNAAQWGHLHGVQFDTGANLWRAWAVWTDIAFLLPPILNIGVVAWAPGGAGALQQNPNNINGGDFFGMVRNLPIYRAQRTSNVSTYWTSAPWVHGLQVGQLISVAGMANSAFNITSLAITAVDRAVRTFSVAQVAANATDADAGGTASQAAPLATQPFMLATRLVGNTLTAKQWRPEEPEPDWADPARTYSVTISAGSPSAPTATGDCGLWVGHLSTGNTMRFGGVRCRRL